MAEPLRLCTWNIQFGFKLEIILDAITTQRDFRNIDLLGLQESSIHSEQEDAHRIAAALGPHYASYQFTAHVHREFAQANAMVWNTSRLHMGFTDSINLPRVGEVKLSRLERVLLRTKREQARISIVLDCALGDEMLRLYVAHLDTLGLAHKWEQFNRILEDAASRQPPVDFTIIMGDLNTFKIRSFPSWGRMAATAQKLGFEDLTTEIRWTHQAFRRVPVRQKLDAIFVRRAQPYKYRSWTLEIPGSDHLPVFAEITI